MSAALDPGCVRLRLSCAQGRISAVAVVSQRPAVASLLRGRPADAAVRLLPLLFALCGQAQGRAAALALAAARGAECAAYLDVTIQREALREHLWRWLLDLPPLLGQPALREEFIAATRWIAGGQREELGALLGSPPVEALCRRLAEQQDVAEAEARLLPMLDARSSLDLWPRLAASFCQQPHWQNAAAETGALARRQSRGRRVDSAFAARWLARLEELRDWADGKEAVGDAGTASAAPGASGSGRALVETARGLLMHEIVLDGERIADYFIVAPTEWNFHPQGPLAGWLIGRNAGDRDAVQAFVAGAIATLDPCVRWELEWL